MKEELPLIALAFAAALGSIASGMPGAAWHVFAALDAAGLCAALALLAWRAARAQKRVHRSPARRFDVQINGAATARILATRGGAVSLTIDGIDGKGEAVRALKGMIGERLREFSRMEVRTRLLFGPALFAIDVARVGELARALEEAFAFAEGT